METVGVNGELIDPNLVEGALGGIVWGTIAGLLSITEEMYGLTDNAAILSSIYSYTAFLQGKEL